MKGVNLNQAIVGIAGCLAVIAGLAFTKNANCLWALYLVYMAVGAASSDCNCNCNCQNCNEE